MRRRRKRRSGETSIVTRAGTSLATRSSAPRAAGAPVVAAITDGAVTRGRSDVRIRISLNAVDDRSLIVFSSAWPTAVSMNASPSCTP